MTNPSDIDAEQVDRFLAGRLRGRPVPADLYRLVQLHLAGVLDDDTTPEDLQGLRLIGPDEIHALADNSYLNDNDRADWGVMANVAGIDALLANTAPITEGANGVDGAVIGYWVYPGEAGDVLIQLDTEGDLSICEAKTLVGAVVEPESYADVAAWDAVLGQALATEDGEPPSARVDPYDARFAAQDAERRRLYADLVDRVARAGPDPDLLADGDRLVGLIGADVDGPELSSVLVTVGATEQAGGDEVSAVDPHGLTMTFMSAGRKGPDRNRPLLDSLRFYATRYRGRLPRGLVATDTHESARAKLGPPEPRGRALIVDADTWHDGPLRLVVYYREGILHHVLATGRRS
ncbi:MAG TPA: hypothetical protein VK453_28695 [Micromonosporaceae bacterium]|nr:hypothetical protein [Micromonosporaceae bacterium]